MVRFWVREVRRGSEAPRRRRETVRATAFPAAGDGHVVLIWEGSPILSGHVYGSIAHARNLRETAASTTPRRRPQPHLPSATPPVDSPSACVSNPSNRLYHRLPLSRRLYPTRTNTMASVTDASASNGDGLTAAERLMRQHEQEEAAAKHHASVEDVPDEEALLHPAPSGLKSLPISTNPSRVATPSSEATMSAKAAGKQPAREQPPAADPPKPAFDPKSEDAFPALGGPKAAPAAAAPTPWSRKPAAVGKAANGIPNGLANGNMASSKLSSGASTPLSGIVTPSSTAPSQRGPTPQMALPGRYSEQIQLHPSMMTPRNQLKKPVMDILRDINKRSKANVEMKAGPGGIVVFEGTGPVDAVRVALKEVATQLCSKVRVSR